MHKRMANFHIFLLSYNCRCEHSKLLDLIFKAFSRDTEKSIKMTWSDDRVTIHSTPYICTVSFARKTFPKILKLLMLHY